MDATSKNLIIHTRFSEKQYQMIEAASEDLGMKLTEFIRYAIICWFEGRYLGRKPTLTPEELEQIKENPSEAEGA